MKNKKSIKIEDLQFMLLGGKTVEFTNGYTEGHNDKLEIIVDYEIGGNHHYRIWNGSLKLLFYSINYAEFRAELDKFIDKFSLCEAEIQEESSKFRLYLKIIAILRIIISNKFTLVDYGRSNTKSVINFSTKWK